MPRHHRRIISFVLRKGRPDTLRAAARAAGKHLPGTVVNAIASLRLGEWQASALCGACGTQAAPPDAMPSAVFVIAPAPTRRDDKLLVAGLCGICAAEADADLSKQCLARLDRAVSALGPDAAALICGGAGIS